MVDEHGYGHELFNFRRKFDGKGLWLCSAPVGLVITVERIVGASEHGRTS